MTTALQIAEIIYIAIPALYMATRIVRAIEDGKPLKALFWLLIAGIALTLLRYLFRFITGTFPGV